VDVTANIRETKKPNNVRRETNLKKIGEKKTSQETLHSFIFTRAKLRFKVLTFW